MRSFLDLFDAGDSCHILCPRHSQQTKYHRWRKWAGDYPSKIGILLLPLRAWRNWQTRKT
jgi:hypothetical protein